MALCCIARRYTAGTNAGVNEEEEGHCGLETTPGLMSKPIGGRAQALLDKAKREEQRRLPVFVLDAETGERVQLNTKPAVDDAGLERREVRVWGADAPHAGRGAKAAPAAARPNGPPPLAPGVRLDAAQQVQLLRAEHAKRMLELVAKEASRESLRREVLQAEPSEWRKTLQKRCFIAERLHAATELDRERANQEMELAALLKALGMLKKGKS